MQNTGVRPPFAECPGPGRPGLLSINGQAQTSPRKPGLPKGPPGAQTPTLLRCPTRPCAPAARSFRRDRSVAKHALKARALLAKQAARREKDEHERRKCTSTQDTHDPWYGCHVLPVGTRIRQHPNTTLRCSTRVPETLSFRSPGGMLQTTGICSTSAASAGPVLQTLAKNMAQYWPTWGNHGPNSARMRSTQKSWSMLVEAVPTGRSRPRCVQNRPQCGRFRATLVEVVGSLAKAGRRSARCGPIRATEARKVRFRPGSARPWRFRQMQGGLWRRSTCIPRACMGFVPAPGGEGGRRTTLAPQLAARVTKGTPWPKANVPPAACNATTTSAHPPSSAPGGDPSPKGDIEGQGRH